ncbi:MAG: NAD(P)/FAD-dependent oxidoreductase [Planctomycetota bacterium]
MYDVAVIGGGIAGMATAARLQRRGMTTVVLEAHGQPGGCAGFFRRSGFSFDVGATTLVDFAGDGVGAELLRDIEMPLPDSETLPGYVAWLPDRTVTLHRDHDAWSSERLRMLGNSDAHQRFWNLLDHLSRVFWSISRRGAKLPCQTLHDAINAVRLLGITNLPAARFLRWTLGDALKHFRLRDDRPLVGLLSMLVEDTVHSSIDHAPLINAALGVTIRGAGLTRAKGGMRGFWRRFVEHYKRLGGQLRVGCKVHDVRGRIGRYEIQTRRGVVQACQVVSAIPASLTARIAAPVIGGRLDWFVRRDADSMGGAVVVFLGVPEEQVSCHEFTHHQLLQDYESPLGNGNNMFISVSSPGDTESAVAGHRAVMISTHCDLDEWKQLSQVDYAQRKAEAGERLVALARRVYPRLGHRPLVYEVATPRTFERFTQRPDGAVGGVRQTLKNSNQSAIPHDMGVPGFFLVGDTTWPGLGTVACVLGSRIVTKCVMQQCGRTIHGSNTNEHVANNIAALVD